MLVQQLTSCSIKCGSCGVPLFGLCRYEPARIVFPRVDVDECCAIVRVPAAVKTQDELHLVDTRMPATPQVAHVFDLHDAARQMRAQLDPAAATRQENDMQRTQPSGIPTLPPPQYPLDTQASNQTSTTISLTPGEARPYLDPFSRITAQLLGSEMERDARRHRMAKRQAELMAQLQVEAN